MARIHLESAGEAFEGRGFRVIVGEEQVLLAVDSSIAGNKPVTLDEVRMFFAQQGWPWENPHRIESIIAQNDGQPQVIVEDLPGVKSDAALHLRIASDQMRVYARITPAVWGKQVTRADVKQQLVTMGINYGVQVDIVEQMLAGQMFDREWTIAQGRAVQNGGNARLEYQPVMQKTGGKPTFLPDGRVDFRELDNITVVKSGQVLATRIPPTAGVAGRNVLGEELPPVPGRDLVWPAGKGVGVVDDQLVASIDGQVVLKSGRVNVLPVYDVSGNVDYSTGNVRFNGNVQIRGSVKPGFMIEAEGDIKILGGVDSANIICGGTLTVGGGIQGQGRGVVQVEGDVYSRFIENCQVTAGGAIVIGEDIMHSQVAAGRSIQVGGRKGLIVGGVVRATDSIECKVLGASFGTPTAIEVGVNPAIFEQFGQLQGTIAKSEDELRKLRQGINRFEQLKSATGALSPSRQEMLTQFTRAYEQRSQELSSLAWQLSQQEKAIAAIKNAIVKVTDCVHPGVRVGIGKSIYQTTDSKRGGTFSLKDGDVTFSSQ